MLNSGWSIAVLKVTDKELSMVKVCLGQRSQLFTELVLSVSTGDIPLHVAQARAGLLGRLGVPTSALGRILYSFEGT